MYLAAPGWGPGRASMTEDEMRKRLASLRVEHRDLDIAIEALVQSGGPSTFIAW